jgi:CheY-like chemotaxis protein
MTSIVTGAQATARVVLVEDNPPDILLIEEAVREYRLAVQLVVFRDGDAAYRYWDQAFEPASGCPALVLLDLNLPKRNGLEVLERIRRHTECRNLPVVIMSSSTSPAEVQRARDLGIAHYFRKPSNFADFLKIGAVIQSLIRDSSGSTL